MSLHGAYLWPGFQRRLSLWNEVADAQGFIVAYPAALGFPRLWRGQAPGPELAREVRFFADLIDELSVRFNIDSTRIYANGYSNGAAMTFMLSCTLADRIAAFGMVATAVVPWDWCEDRRPIPMIAFHGTAGSVRAVRRWRELAHHRAVDWATGVDLGVGASGIAATRFPSKPGSPPT